MEERRATGREKRQANTCDNPTLGSTQYPRVLRAFMGHARRKRNTVGTQRARDRGIDREGNASAIRGSEALGGRYHGELLSAPSKRSREIHQPEHRDEPRVVTKWVELRILVFAPERLVAFLVVPL